MKKLLLFLLIFVPFILPAQEAEPILTKEQNSEWVKKLAKQDLDHQLEMLKKRWKADAELHFKVSASPHKIILENEVSPKCRPLYLINNGEDQIIYPANPSSQVVAEVSKMMIPENISEVKAETGIKIQAIYGQRGSCGVIVITVSDNTIFDRIASEAKK